MLSLLSLIIAHAEPNPSEDALKSNTETQEGSESENQEETETQEELQIRIDNLQKSYC